MSLCPIIKYGDPRLAKWTERAPAFDVGITRAVSQIIDEVLTKGIDAVREQVRKFDAPGIENLFATEAEIFKAEVSDEHLAAIRAAIERVRDFHEVQLDVLVSDWEEMDLGWAWRTSATERKLTKENMPTVKVGPFNMPAAVGGVTPDGTIESGMLGQRLIPLRRVGVYVPGGKASYPSSVIMNVIPAQVARVEEIVVATPPRKDGTLDPAVLVACRELGITRILKAGGPSAIAALAFGFEGFARVDKIVGPGSKYVNEAKRQLWGTVGLDSYAGPSEVCVLAGPDCDPLAAAADWLTQVEHSEDNIGVVVCFSDEMAQNILKSAEIQIFAAPRREILRTALSNEGVIVVAETLDEAVTFVNDFAPEHLSILTENADAIVGAIRNAGCIALGAFTPQSAGDFASGPSHTLPTAGAARFAGPLNVQDFLKFQSISQLEKEDLEELLPIIEAFGEMEGFPAHAMGAKVRLSGTS
jgi:histidinol dehydrogenase